MVTNRTQWLAVAAGAAAAVLLAILPLFIISVPVRHSALAEITAPVVHEDRHRAPPKVSRPAAPQDLTLAMAAADPRALAVIAPKPKPKPVSHPAVVVSAPGTQVPSTPTAPPPPPPALPVPAPAGDYSCSALEALWIQAGGNPGEAFIAAEIAMAESGGDPNAISPTDDYGLWQINGSWGPLATLVPLANAEAAVRISDDGTDWTPWTTYQTGAYEGLC